MYLSDTFMSEIRKVEDLGVRFSKVARLKVPIWGEINGRNSYRDI